jgi:hypothetical protein
VTHSYASIMKTKFEQSIFIFVLSAYRFNKETLQPNCTVLRKVYNTPVLVQVGGEIKS